MTPLLAQERCGEGEIRWQIWKNTPTLDYEVDSSFFLDTPLEPAEDVFATVVAVGGRGAPQGLLRLTPRGDILYSDISRERPQPWKKLTFLSDCPPKGCKIFALPGGGTESRQVFLERKSDQTVFRLVVGEDPQPQRVVQSEGVFLGGLLNRNSQQLRIYSLKDLKIYSRLLQADGSVTGPVEEYLGFAQNPLFLVFARKQTMPALAFQFAEARTGTLNMILLGAKEVRGQIVGSFEPLLIEWPKRSFPLDANGDSRIDLLASRVPARHAYVAIEDKEGYFEKQLQLPGIDFSVDVPLFGADFNDDGFDDLYFYADAKRGIRRAFARTAERLPSLKFTLGDTSLNHLTGVNGDVCLLPKEVIEGEAVRSSGKIFQIVSVMRSGEVGKILLRELASHGERFSLDTAPIPPYVCVGYHAMTYQEDGNSKWGRRESYCPPHSGSYFTPEADLEPTANIASRLACCPLPGEDILAEKQVRAEGSCPEGMIAIGSVRRDEKDFNSTRDLICSPVSERYQLGPETGGFYVGQGFSARAHKDRLRLGQVPAAIRSATNRLEFAYWYGDGCIGVPFGSLFTGRLDEGRGCSRTRFRQLQYRGLPGDPPQGTPVRMFPDCAAIDNIFRPDARCAF